MLKLKLQFFGQLMWRTEAGGKGDNIGWDGCMASPTQWTWVWESSRSLFWIGKPGLLQSMGLQRGGHNWVTELTEHPLGQSSCWKWKFFILLHGWVIVHCIYVYYIFIIHLSMNNNLDCLHCLVYCEQCYNELECIFHLKLLFNLWVGTCLLHWQASSLPLHPLGRAGNSNIKFSHLIQCLK